MPKPPTEAQGPPGLRRARDADAQDLFGLLALCFADYPGCFVDPHADLADLRRPGSAYAASGGGLWVVEDENGRVCACIGLDHRQDGLAEMHRLYVRPDRRRAGVATALMRFAEAQAMAAGADRILCWSDTRFAAAHRLYEALGYRRVGPPRPLGDISQSWEHPFGKRLPP